MLPEPRDAADSIHRRVVLMLLRRGYIGEAATPDAPQSRPSAARDADGRDFDERETSHPA